MFQLTISEYNKILMSQNVTSNWLLEGFKIMKDLVDVTSFDTLQRIKSFFISDNEITFHEYCDKF